MDTGKKSSRNDQNTPTIQYETTEKISDLRKLSISQILSPKVKKTVQHSREMSLTSESLEDKNEENQYEKETTFEQLRTDKVKENNGKQKNIEIETRSSHPTQRTSERKQMSAPSPQPHAQALH